MTAGRKGQTGRTEADWAAKGYSRLSLRYPADTIDQIRRNADAAGLKVAAYILRAVRRDTQQIAADMKAGRKP